MAGLEELKKKLVPLFDAEKGFSSASTLDPSDSYMVSQSLYANVDFKIYYLMNNSFFMHSFLMGVP